jgi:hypothetical protein
MSNVDEMRLMHDLVYQVREYVPGPVAWIAKQKDEERDDFYGFVIGKGFAVVTIEQVLKADDALIKSLAAQILGYEVDSKQDLERRRDEAVSEVNSIDEQIQRLRTQREYWEQRRWEAIAKLETITRD